MARLFIQNLSIHNNDNLPNGITRFKNLSYKTHSDGGGQFEPD